jgi:hypothetical protein
MARVIATEGATATFTSKPGMNTSHRSRLHKRAVIRVEVRQAHGPKTGSTT